MADYDFDFADGNTGDEIDVQSGIMSPFCYPTILTCDVTIPPIFWSK